MNKLSLVVAVGLVLALGSVAQAITVDLASTTDNYYDLYIDGTDGSGNAGVPAISVGTTNAVSEWNSPETGSYSLESGQRHVVAVKAQNFGPFGGYNPAAFIASLHTGDGSYFVETGTSTMVTDSSWLVYFGQGEAPADQGPLKWYDVDYDDSAWVAAEDIGPNGTAPWGNMDEIDPDARWIWTANWDSPLADTPVYLRQGFTPVPEPMTMLAVFTGLAGLGGYIRKRL